MKQKFLILLLASMFIQPAGVRAQSSAPSCSFQPDGSIICTIGGGDDGGGEDDGGGGSTCVPGEHMVYVVTAFDAAAGTCSAYPAWVDNCTGQIVESGGDVVEDLPCSPQAPEPENPCDIFSVSAGGITCENTEWDLSARVTFPEIFLDVRPYPATLVRLPTAIRIGGLPESSGSDGLDYLP